MLKKKLTQAEFADLDKALQALYKKAEGSDNYLLDVEDDDGAELKRAKDREKKRADKLEADLKALKDEFDELQNERDKQGTKGLDEAGVTKLKKQHEDALAAMQRKIDAKTAALTQALVDSEAAKLANDISVVPDLLTGVIRGRLKLVEESDGTHTVKVLDANGNETDKKIEDLRKEIVADTKFAPIIKASNASGGGAAGAKGGGAAGKKLSEMTATEEAAFANEHPEQYKAMLAAEQS